MTEDDAQTWLTERLDVSRETMARLAAFATFLRAEAAQQNLISASTLEHIWARHILDSAQLLRFAPPEGDWLDLGSGAGFPGIVVALLGDYRVTLVESRARRVDYLQRAVVHLGLDRRVKVAGLPLERLETAPYQVISARAFAPLPRLLDLSARFSTASTLWLLPKGRNADKELAESREVWNLDFSVETSITDDEAGILAGTIGGRRAKAANLNLAKGRKRR